ncbi:GNAT family N-acetyltransferase [Polymorphobacter multimanifer]|nr:GNAT family N-acetyltransferase [Polymorphobacter multimanifer]
MAGLSREEALAFWTSELAAAEAGAHLVIAAVQGQSVVGVVVLDIDMPPNQPHRADVRKLIVAEDQQRAGLGTALLARAEAEARSRERWLLVLDTISGGGAARLYARSGWQKVGDIPAYAMLPHGGYAPTTIYFKRL